MMRWGSLRTFKEGSCDHDKLKWLQLEEWRVKDAIDIYVLNITMMFEAKIHKQTNKQICEQTMCEQENSHSESRAAFWVVPQQIELTLD